MIQIDYTKEELNAIGNAAMVLLYELQEQRKRLDVRIAHIEAELHAVNRAARMSDVMSDQELIECQADCKKCKSENCNSRRFSNQEAVAQCIVYASDRQEQHRQLLERVYEYASGNDLLPPGLLSMIADAAGIRQEDKHGV